MSIFRLAEEEPSLRPSDRAPTRRAAAKLGERTGAVPRPVVEDLIDVLHQQARAMEGLVEQVERAAGHLPGVSGEFSAAASQLSELHQRARALATPAAATA